MESVFYGFETINIIYMEFTKEEQEALKWLLLKGMEITKSNKKYEIFDKIRERLVKMRSEQLPCSHEFTPRKAWVHKCIKCGELNIEYREQT